MSEDAKLKAEIGRLGLRVAEAESVARMLLGVQRTSLAAAERLRKAAVALVGGNVESLKPGVRRATVSPAKLRRLDALLKNTPAFHVPPPGKPPADPERAALLARSRELRKALDDALGLMNVADHAQDDGWRAEEQRIRAIASKGGKTR